MQQDLLKELVDAVVEINQSTGNLGRARGEVVEAQRVVTRLEEQAKVDQALLGELNSAKLKLLEKKEDFEQAQYELCIATHFIKKPRGASGNGLGVNCLTGSRITSLLRLRSCLRNS